MPNNGIYFRKEEWELIRKKDKGFIRRAVLKELYKGEDVRRDNQVNQ